MPMRTASQLKQLGAKDTTERDIKTNDLLEVRCVSCENTRFQEWHYITRRFNERGYGYKCEKCHSNEKKNPLSSMVSIEKLREMLATDVSERIITSHQKVQFYCYNVICRKIGARTYSESLKTFKKLGYYYKCKECVKREHGEALSKKEGWRENISNSLKNSQKAKNSRKILSIKKMINKNIKNVLDYWDFDTDIREFRNTVIVSGICKKCGNASKKEIRKFIEATQTRTKGCANCWYEFSKTEEFIRQRRNESMEFWCSDAGRVAASEVSKRSVLQKDNKHPLKMEKEIRSIITSFGFGTSKKRIRGYCEYYGREITRECDILIPSMRIGIEFNGAMYHSYMHMAKKLKEKILKLENSDIKQEAKNERIASIKKDLSAVRYYHKSKNDLFKNSGIRLISINECDWRYRKDQVISKLKSELSVGPIIDLKSLKIVEISKKACNLFLDANYEKSNLIEYNKALSAKIGNEIIAVLCINSKEVEAFCSVPIKNSSEILDQLSRVASNMIGSDIYFNLEAGSWNFDFLRSSGWEEVGELPIDYFFNSRSARLIANKPKQHQNEVEFATENNIYLIYDCGKIRFAYKYPNNSKDLPKHK